MIIRLTILAFTITLHFLTPAYFLNDFLRSLENIMIFSLVLCVIIYFLKRKNKTVTLLSLILSINIALYFLITARESIQDIGHPRMLYRIKLIAGIKSGLTNTWGSVMEYLNYVQVGASIIILFILIRTSVISKNDIDIKK